MYWTEDKSAIKGTISLQYAQVSVFKHSGKDWEMQIKMTGRTYVLRAEDTQDERVVRVCVAKPVLGIKKLTTLFWLQEWQTAIRSQM